MRVVTHNIDEPRDPKDAARALARATGSLDVQVYALQDCKGAKRAFIEEFGSDYRVLMSDADGASLITMVQRGLKIENERYLHMTMEWIGPKLGIRQAPRIHNLTDVVFEGDRFRVYNNHRVWMPKDQSRGLSSVAAFNQHAWNEEHRRIRRTMHKPGSQKRTTLNIGDQNSVVFDRSGYSVWRLAQQCDARIIRTGAAVDWGFVINGRGDGEARGRIGSDHPHAIVDVWKAGR
jgi:hypothetical protein